MKKAKFLLLAVFVGLVCLAAGCGGGGSAGGGGKTFYFMSHDDMTTGFQGVLYNAIKERAEAQGYTVEAMSAQNDANLQIDQMNEVLAKKPAGIVLLPIDASALLPSVEKANDEKVPVLITNRDIAEGAKVAQVHSDEYQAGKLQGEFMAKNLKQGAKIVYIYGDTTQASANERFRGFKENCLDKRPDIELLAAQDGKWSRSTALKYMTLWLKIFPEIDGVVAGNDDMIMGAIIALKSAGRLDGVLTSGVDAIDEAVKSVAAGELSQTVKQDAEGSADKIVELLEGMATNGQSDEDAKVPFIEITNANISQYLK